MEYGTALRIGALARAVGVNVESVRYYQRRGLLPEPKKPAGGIRRYGEADVARFRFVKAAQRLGLSLEEVAVLLSLDDGGQCDDARSLAQNKLAEVRTRLEGLRQVESILVRLIEDCGARRGRVACPVIAALQG